MKKEYLFSGTIGDAYIALCKLSSLENRDGIVLRRMSRIAGKDRKIKEITKLFSDIEYNINYIHFNTIAEMREYAFNNKNRYINIFYDGNGRGNEPDDPPELVFNSNPILNLDKTNQEREKKIIGLQLNSGSRDKDRRLLDLNWVEEIVYELSRSEKIEILIVGNGDGYNSDEIIHLNFSSKNCRFLVKNDSLLDWLNRLVIFDFLITPEGLPSFFSSSQEIPSIILFTTKSAILRMPNKWRESSICLKAKLNNRNNCNNRWSAIPAKDVANIILAKFDPESL